MYEALFYEKLDDGKVKCNLCPHFCVLKEGHTGKCKVRSVSGGNLVSDNYGLLTAINFDPIEKKPLYHFYPGKEILSLGSNGCNLKCKCCQNWEIAHTSVKNYPHFKKYEIYEIINLALRHSQNTGIAYTYNEPTVWFEFMLDVAREAAHNNLKNIVVSNGYINPEPLEMLCEYADAFNIDLKGFSDDFYQKVTSSTLEPVKETLKALVDRNKHVEVTNLIIPTLNDDSQNFTEMVKWIADVLGRETVLHLSRYFPVYKMNIEATPPESMTRLYTIAKEHLSYVYLGNINISDAQDTVCPVCHRKVIERRGYFTDITGIGSQGECVQCGKKIVIN